MKVNGKEYPIYYGKIKNVPNHQPDSNVVKTIIHHPMFDGLYHPFMVKLGMVYDIVFTTLTLLWWIIIPLSSGSIFQYHPMSQYRCMINHDTIPIHHGVSKIFHNIPINHQVAL